MHIYSTASYRNALACFVWKHLSISHKNKFKLHDRTRLFLFARGGHGRRGVRLAARLTVLAAARDSRTAERGVPLGPAGSRRRRRGVPVPGQDPRRAGQRATVAVQADGRRLERCRFRRVFHAHGAVPQVSCPPSERAHAQRFFSNLFEPLRVGEDPRGAGQRATVAVRADGRGLER